MLSPYHQYVYSLAVNAGYDHDMATNLAEMAVFKKTYEGLQYSDTHEKILHILLSRKHHQSPHCDEKDRRMKKETGGSGTSSAICDPTS